MAWTPLPIGVENFEDLMTHGYYYVDKTLFIKELLDMKGKVNLFTRPRRFGKTLNMSMLRYFLDCEYPETEKLFSGTKILEAGEEYKEYMGRYPVISVTLKSMKQATYEEAFYCLKEEIAREYRRHDKILDSLDQEEDRENSGVLLYGKPSRKSTWELCGFCQNVFSRSMAKGQ
ncbi:AAA family ATPase [Blautia sp. An81]|uniref:AAA family ATPase n=1 Tax=Blautia sp. An81 TaxID=1965659 RepID=UPI0026D72F19|nr:AAA family ATPase [Blautia sp. An81]